MNNLFIKYWIDYDVWLGDILCWANEHKLQFIVIFFIILRKAEAFLHRSIVPIKFTRPLNKISLFFMNFELWVRNSTRYFFNRSMGCIEEYIIGLHAGMINGGLWLKWLIWNFISLRCWIIFQENLLKHISICFTSFLWYLNDFRYLHEIQ